MVLQVLADAREVVRHGDAERREVRGGAQPRELQQVRGAYGAGGEQHLPRRAHAAFAPALAEHDTRNAPAFHLQPQRERALGLFRIVFAIVTLGNINGLSDLFIYLFTDEGLFLTDAAREVFAKEQFAGFGDGIGNDAYGFFGFDAVLLAPRCADPLYRRSIKVGMGAVFSTPWTRIPDWYDALPDLSRRGFTTVALTLGPDSVPIEEAVAGVDRLALVLGSEGHGLSSRWEASADRRAVIPMAAGIDSLNVAAASAVACYAAARR